MSQAEELLNTLSDEYATGSGVEEHIIIGEDRSVSVPNSLRRIAVQFDHNVETVTFDCPRYWDGNDLSEMYIYINYQKPDKTKGRYLTKNIRIDDTDENLIHFDWTIGNEFTDLKGNILFLACAVQTDSEGMEEIHWNSELCKDIVVSEGLECTEDLIKEYPDIINDLLFRMDTLIAADTPILDTSLSQPGFAADAEAAGVILRRIDEKISTIIEGTEYIQVEGNPLYIKDCGRNTCNITVKGDAEQDITEESIPSPENPVEVLSVTGENKVVINNKNLFNKKVTNYTSFNVTFNTNEDGSVTIVGTPSRSYIQFVINEKVFIPKGTEIAISYGKTKELLRDSTANPFVWLLNKNKESIGSYGKNDSSFILSDDLHYITYGFENMTVDKNINETVYCQFEIGSLNTEYVTPESVEFPINLGDMKLLKIADYEDYIYKNEEESKWYKKKYIGTKTLAVSGTSAVGPASDNLVRFYYSVSDRKLINNNQNIYVLSNKFTAMSSSEYGLDENKDIQAISANRDNLAIFFRISKETIGGDTVELCNAYLTENPIEVYYILAEPVDEEITNEILIAQLEKLEKAKTYTGNNLIALVCDNKVKGNLSLEYRQFAVCSYGDLEEIQEDLEALRIKVEEDISASLEELREEVNASLDEVNASLDEVNASIPTKVSQLTNDSNYATTSALTTTNTNVSKKTVYGDFAVTKTQVSHDGSDFVIATSHRNAELSATVTKSGYYPIALVGVQSTSSEYKYDFRPGGLTNQASGSCKAVWVFTNDEGQSKNASDLPACIVSVLWVKIR